MDTPLIAGLFGLLGVFVGGIIQFWFSRRTHRESRYLELKSEACADYVNSVAALKFASPADLNKARQEYTAAKGRLCVFGDKDVIAAAVLLECTSRSLDQSDAQGAFVNLLQVMRRRGIAVGEATDRDFRILLLGEGPSN